MANIVEQKIWDKYYKDYKFFIANDKLTEKLKSIYISYLKNHNFGNIFEIGCFPGRYLSYFAKLGKYEANGVDLTNELNDNFINWLKKNDIKVGKIVRDDAFKYIDKNIKNKYDITYSLGFIEHFTNYLEAIDYHIKSTKKGGYIIITTPNFKGWYQNFLHKWLDKDNYDRHVIKSMNPDERSKFFEKKNCKVIESGYFGNFDFWVDKTPNNIFKKIIIYLNLLLAKYNRLPNNKAYSPYCYIIAKKEEN